MHLFNGQEAVLYSRLAFLDVQYYQITGLVYYLNSAEKLMVKLEGLADPNNTGLFSGSYFGWDQASPLVAYATLYQATRDEIYLHKANVMIQSLDQNYRLGEPGVAESYWGYTDTNVDTGVTYQHLDSSTHMQYLEAFTILAIATGDSSFLNRAEMFRNFAVQYLYIPNHNGTVSGWFGNFCLMRDSRACSKWQDDNRWMLSCTDRVSARCFSPIKRLARKRQ